MIHMNNSPQKAPVSQQKKRKEPFKRKIKKFMHTVKKNNWDRIGSFIFVCIIIFLIGRGYQSNIDKRLMEVQKTEIINEYENKIAEIDIAHSKELDSLKNEYETVNPEELIKFEAEYIAKVLYGAAKDNNERDQRTAVWCILNRVDNPAYPNTVKGVCDQASQWMGYSDNNPVLTSLYNTAMRELEVWHSGYRPVSADYIYMSWSSKEIVLRDTYEKEPNTKYWQVG